MCVLWEHSKKCALKCPGAIQIYQEVPIYSGKANSGQDGWITVTITQVRSTECLCFSVVNNRLWRHTAWWDLRWAVEEMEYGGEALHFGAVPMLRKTLQCRWWCFPPRYWECFSLLGRSCWLHCRGSDAYLCLPWACVGPISLLQLKPRFKWYHMHYSVIYSHYDVWDLEAIKKAFLQNSLHILPGLHYHILLMCLHREGKITHIWTENPIETAVAFKHVKCN